MKTDKEIFDIVIKRRDEYEAGKKVRNRRFIAVGSTAAVIAVCAAVGLASHKGLGGISVARGAKDALGSKINSFSRAEEQTAVTYPDAIYGGPDGGLTADSTTPENGEETEWTGKEMQTTQKIYDGAFVPSNLVPTTEADRAATAESGKAEKTTASVRSGGDTRQDEFMGGPFIPANPKIAGAKPGVKIVGEKITDAEAKAYFEKNTWIVSALSSSGVPSDNLKIADKGYCHVSYDGTEGKQAEVRQNFRDYLVYNNGKLVAIVTLVKENGEISATPAFGGPHFDSFNAFLQKHKGEKLLFVYAGWMEIVITPDGKCVNPQGNDLSEYGLDSLGNPYDYFYNEAATYTP